MVRRVEHQAIRIGREVVIFTLETSTTLLARGLLVGDVREEAAPRGPETTLLLSAANVWRTALEAGLREVGVVTCEDPGLEPRHAADVGVVGAERGRGHLGVAEGSGIR
jgi:hypothetical protein